MHATPLPTSITLTVTFQESLPHFREALADMSYHISHPDITGWCVDRINSSLATVNFTLTAKEGSAIDANELRHGLDIGFQRLDGHGEYSITTTVSIERDMTMEEVAMLAA